MSEPSCEYKFNQPWEIFACSVLQINYEYIFVTDLLTKPLSEPIMACCCRFNEMLSDIVLGILCVSHGIIIVILSGYVCEIYSVKISSTKHSINNSNSLKKYI